MLLIELFDNESKWIKKYHAHDKDGFLAIPEHPEAVCWCLQGGLLKIYGDTTEWQEKHRELEAIIKRLFPCNWKQANIVVEFNDKYATFNDIRKVCIEAAKVGI